MVFRENRVNVLTNWNFHVAVWRLDSSVSMCVPMWDFQVALDLQFGVQLIPWSKRPKNTDPLCSNANMRCYANYAALLAVVLIRVIFFFFFLPCPDGPLGFPGLGISMIF